MVPSLFCQSGRATDKFITLNTGFIVLYPLIDVDMNDKWSAVCRMIDAFNLCHAELFYPSWQINVHLDKSMSA